MKIDTCTNKHILRKLKFLPGLDLQTKNHNFLKITMFCKKIITFSSSAHLMKKSTFLTKFHFLFIYLFIFFFFCSKLNFLHQIWCWKNTCHFIPKFAQYDFITVLKNSLIWPKTNTFLPKENNSSKNWHFSKTGDTALRKLTRN